MSTDHLDALGPDFEQRSRLMPCSMTGNCLRGDCANSWWGTIENYIVSNSIKVSIGCNHPAGLKKKGKNPYSSLFSRSRKMMAIPRLIYSIKSSETRQAVQLMNPSLYLPCTMRGTKCRVLRSLWSSKSYSFYLIWMLWYLWKMYTWSCKQMFGWLAKQIWYLVNERVHVHRALHTKFTVGIFCPKLEPLRRAQGHAIWTGKCTGDTH
jgi:hypothetical protein